MTSEIDAREETAHKKEAFENAMSFIKVTSNMKLDLIVSKRQGWVNSEVVDEHAKDKEEGRPSLGNSRL